jgi:hypothetical protein
MVVFASGRSQVAAPDIVNIDKLTHFAVFGLLATLVVRCPGVGRLSYAIGLVSLFGISDELRQSFTPGRSVEFADWIADTAGAACAVLLYGLWPAYRRCLETPLGLPWRRRPAAAPTTPETIAPDAADLANDPRP